MHNFITLYVSSEYWIIAKGYTLYKYNPQTKERVFFARINNQKYKVLAQFKLTRRLFRAEIRHLYHFKNDNWMCIGKKALYKLNKANSLFEKCCTIEKGSRPMNLCQSNDGTIYFGEYCYNPQKNRMYIFQSKDDGNTWTIAYTFCDGEINHIHGIFQDPFSNKIWVATGDDDNGCILGYTEDGFKTFVRKYKGSQQYRVCQPLFMKDDIIFATDTQYEQNYIRAINRETGEVRNIQPIQGSGIYGVQWGNKMMISTTVEPSKVNIDESSHLWYSEDGEDWHEIAAYRKDFYPKTYFQFGSLLFPVYEGDSDYLVWYGRAVNKLDGKSMIKKI